MFFYSRNYNFHCSQVQIAELKKQAIDETAEQKFLVWNIMVFMGDIICSYLFYVELRSEIKTIIKTK